MGAEKVAGIPIDVLLARKIPTADAETSEPVDSCELEDGETIDKDFIKSVEREFVESADSILEMLDLSHLKVSPENES